MSVVWKIENHVLEEKMNSLESVVSSAMIDSSHQGISDSLTIKRVKSDIEELKSQLNK